MLKDLNVNIDFLYNDYDIRVGFYLECVVGGLFIFILLFIVLDIKYYEKKEIFLISLMINGEKLSVGKDKIVNENKKKGDKFVFEDVIEEKMEKKKWWCCSFLN